MAEIDYDDVVKRIQGIASNCTPMEKKLLASILEEIIDKGYSETYEKIWLADFKEIPVSIEQFLRDPRYLGSTNDCGNMIYRGWWPVYKDVFDVSKEIDEVVLSGATRLGKTSTMVSMMAYQTYLAMCYKNIQSYFKLKSISRITIAFANLTKELAAGVGFHEFQTTLKESPWFVSHGRFTNSVSNYVYIPEGESIDIIPASDAAHLLGMQLWACAIDECNFQRAGVKDIAISKLHMKSLYDTAMTRVTGTFSLHGRVYGKLFTASSKNTDNDYLSDHIEEQLNAGNTHMYLFDKPQWEVIPEEKFSKERFHITIGDRYNRGFVIPAADDDEEHHQEYIKQGYKILAVPKNYEPRFRADYDIALRDIAGISVVGAMGFITQEIVTPCVATDRKNPFYEPILWIGNSDVDTIESHFHLDAVPHNLKRLSQNIHIDFAEVSDHIAISSVGQDGTKVITSLEDNKKIALPFFRQIFNIAIGAPRGDRMSFQKVVNFIIWLRKNGFNINIVSTDKYQSSYVRETLNQQGFSTDTTSVDTTADPYIGLRNALVDQRIELIPYKLQEDELVHLQRSNNGVPDHPPQHNNTSVIPSEANGWSSKGIGKDTADAACGALWDCIQNQQLARPSNQSIAKAIVGVNRPRIYTSNNTLYSKQDSILSRALSQTGKRW